MAAEPELVLPQKRLSIDDVEDIPVLDVEQDELPSLVLEPSVLADQQDMSVAKRRDEWSDDR